MTIAHNSDSLNTGLLLHLLAIPGDNTGTTWHDLAGSHHATLPSGAEFGVDQRPGALAGSVRLDGTGFPTIPGTYGLSSFSVALWLKLDDVTAVCDLLKFRTVSGGLWYYGAVPQLGWAANGSTVSITIPWTPVADRWYHVAYTRSGSTHRLYVDGAEIGSNSHATAQAASTNGLSIGHAGGVDDIRIWSRTLSATEVAQVYVDSLGHHCGTLAFTGWEPDVLAVGFLGDSLVAGYGLNQKPGDIAASLVQASLSTQIVATVSPGVSGATAADYLPGSPHLANAKSLFERHGIRHVMVMLGTNDCGDHNAVTPTQYRANMLAICRDLVADGYTVLLNYPPAFVPPAGYGGVFSTASLARLESYQPQIDSLVNGVTILQGDTTAFDDFAANAGSWIQADNIHLTVAGNAALAQRWAEAIESTLCVAC
jgi:lysophospholipase L1-like esterase